MNVKNKSNIPRRYNGEETLIFKPQETKRVKKEIGEKLIELKEFKEDNDNKGGEE